MSQISPVMRLVLVGAILMLAAWFTVLKPKEETAAVAPANPAVATPAGPESAAGKFEAKAAEGKAKAEADALGAANAGIEEETAVAPIGAPSVSAPSGTASVPTASRVAKLTPLTAKQTSGLPSDVRDALKRRETFVLGVLNDEARPWAPMADDDRLMQRELRKVNRSGGELVVATVPLSRIARFDGLIKALNVTQSPTVVIVDGNRQGVALTGYVDRVSINQAVADARRASADRRITETFLRVTNETCANMNTTFTRLSEPTVRGAGGRWVARLASSQRRYRRAFAGIPAPKRWRSLRKQIVTGMRAGEARLASAVKAKDRVRARAALAAPQDRQLAGTALERRFTAAGLTACSAKRAI